MAISLESISRSTGIKAPRIVVHGGPGLGKTTLAAGAPNPIFICTEDGLGKLEVDAFPMMQSFQDVLDAITVLYSSDHHYQTLVIDSLDHLEPMIWQHLCDTYVGSKGERYQAIEDFGYGRGFLEALNLWCQLLDGLAGFQRRYDLKPLNKEIEMAQLGFNADDYDPADEFEPLPPGEYLTMITEASLDNTKSGGQMVKLTYTVMEGQFEGRKLWSQHNIVNSSPKAQEIGRKEISRIAHAVGQPRINDTEQLLQQVIRITVVLKQDPGFGPKNEVKKWISSGSQPMQSAPAPQQQTPAHNPAPAQQPPHPATQYAAPPWGQK
ncbi:AAA family ATPase [Endozoicomonas acroporae]|uniref:AAA family ATPase n=1 Tax=Endozoicomonas acroporae TaxID=1701104 RepID=UPI0013D6749E|nr:AAA family ATPase [Endozoicomonas acroporae]